MTTKRLNVNIPAGVYDDLRSIADQRGTNMTEVIRLALTLVKLEHAERTRGNALCVVRAGKPIKELLLPY